jgi:multidrug efflux pump subunit AcrA (membrane-fusion protein)
MAETEKNDIELKTEEVNELLSAVPSWIVRNGISYIFLSLLVGLVSLAFMRYPDKLTAHTIITTLNPPARIVAKNNGKVSLLLAQNNEIVKARDILLVIESATNYRHEQYLWDVMDTFQARLNAHKPLPLILSIDSLQLGELTTGFLTFLKSYTDFRLYHDLNPQQKEIDIINRELDTYRVLFIKYQAQEDTYRQEFELTEKDYQRYTALFQSGTVSAKEFEDKSHEYLTSKRNYENTKITSLNNSITLSNLEKNKLQLETQAFQDKEKYFTALDQAMQSMKSLLKNWEQNYLITAPIAGRVSLFNIWTSNQNIKSGDEVMSVVPLEKQEMIAKLTLPVQNSGKLKVNQKVNIKLNNYPYQEFGIVNGNVKSISILPKDNTYAVEVSLPNKLQTSYHKDLDYKEEMEGTAEIITQELSVLDRIFYQFRKITR